MSAVVLVLPDGCRPIERGEVQGVLIRERRGEGGLSYDPVFIPEGRSRTGAELSPEEKNMISHRGRVFRALLPVIIEALKSK